MNINVQLCKETLWILNVYTPPLEQHSASEILPRVALQKTVNRNNLSFQTRSHSRASLVHWVSSGPPSQIIYAVDEEQQRSPTMCQYHDECFNRVKIYFLPFVSIEREKESKKVYFPLVSLPWHRINLLLLFSRWEKMLARHEKFIQHSARIMWRGGEDWTLNRKVTSLKMSDKMICLGNWALFSSQLWVLCRK